LSEAQKVLQLFQNFETVVYAGVANSVSDDSRVTTTLVKLTMTVKADTKNIVVSFGQISHLEI